MYGNGEGYGKLNRSSYAGVEKNMAKKRVEALVRPEILIWARESAGFSIEQVAAISRFSKIEEWETGERRPTIKQLRELAKKYKRPLAVFYLQEKPIGFQVIKDFRRLPGDGMQRMSPQLYLQIREAQERREIALDLLREINDDIHEFSISATLNDSPEIVGAKVRRYLRITDDEQKAWRSTRDAFNGWRALIEEAGALVFQMDKVDTNEASGFALSYIRLPVIAVNRSDELSRRTFSLLHEFAHILLAQSGVSEFYIDITQPPETQDVEIWCNAVAAATLLPRTMFLREELVQNHEYGNPVWSEDDIDVLANIFSMSKVSVVRRLLTLGLTNKAFYKTKEAEYAEKYAEFLKHKKASNKKKKFSGRKMHYEAVSLLGRNFIRMVLTPYYSDRITLRDVSAYLNLKTKHIPNVEKILLKEVVK